MVYEKKFLEKFLKVLLTIKESPIRGAGICGNVDYHLRGSTYYGKHEILLSQIFKIWPEYSGCDLFPISRWSFVLHSCNGTLWEGEYGAARHRLLDFTIGCVKDMIDFIDESVEEDEDD